MEVFSAHGRNPASEWKLSGTASSIRREYDKEVKGYVYVLEGGPTLTKMSLPKDEKQCCKCLSVYLSVCLSVRLSVCLLFVCLSVCLLSVCCLSVCLFVCCLSVVVPGSSMKSGHY